tara:strand:- start:297 stop:878 length:582 start_codon:yes stop_codon:yes gene_type:complete
MKKIIFAIIILILDTNFIFGNEKITKIIDGKKDAKINLIVYESLTCSHCANFHKDVYPLLKENFIDKGIINLEFRNFPLDMAALNASKIAHCKNDGDSKILHFLYNNQNEWAKGQDLDEFNNNLKIIVENENFDLDFKKCLENTDLEDYILEDRIKAVKKYKIEATPTLVIMGKKFNKTLTYKNIKKAIEKLI